MNMEFSRNLEKKIKMQYWFHRVLCLSCGRHIQITLMIPVALSNKWLEYLKNMISLKSISPIQTQEINNVLYRSKL